MSNYLKVSYPRTGGTDLYKSLVTGSYLAEDDGASAAHLLVWSGLLEIKKGYSGEKISPQASWEIAFASSSREAIIEGCSLRFTPVKDDELWDWTFSPLQAHEMIVSFLKEKEAVAAVLRKHNKRLPYSHQHNSLVVVQGEKAELLAITQELKSVGVVAGNIIEITSTWRRATGVSHRFQGKKQLDCKEVFLAGADKTSAKKQLVAKLLLQQVPVLPEWEDALWDELTERKLVAPLLGYNLQGYKISIPREEILAEIFGEKLIKGRKAPRPAGLPVEVFW